MTTTDVKNEQTEIILPSGTFCTIKPVTFGHTIIAAQRSFGASEDYMLHIVALVCLFDGERRTIESLKNMSPGDGVAALDRVYKMMQAAGAIPKDT